MVKQKLNKMKSKKPIMLLILGLLEIRVFINCIVVFLWFRGCVGSLFYDYRYDYEDLGAGYKYLPDSEKISGVSFEMRIPPIVEEYKFDDRFIVAKEVLNGRRPDWSYKLKSSDYYLGFDSTYYWIIDKNDTIRYGPMDYERFQNLCDSLNVGLSL